MPEHHFDAKTLDPSEPLPLNDLRSLDKAVNHLYAVLGTNTLLIPLPPGGIKAKDDTWRKTTLEDSLKPQYQAELRKSSLAVKCGTTSNNLCAINFFVLAEAKSFMLKNPKLGKTLAIQRPGVTAVLFRIKDLAPPTFKAGAAAWLSENMYVPVYCRDEPTFIAILSGNPPVELELAEIKFPKAMEREVYRFITEKLHGLPFTPGRKNQINLNTLYWARFFHSVQNVSFRSKQRQFYVFDDHHKPEPMSEERIANLFLTFFAEADRSQPPFCLSEVDLKRCVQTLKIIAVDPNERPVGDHLEQFLRTTVETGADADVTVEELFSTIAPGIRH